MVRVVVVVVVVAVVVRVRVRVRGGMGRPPDVNGSKRDVVVRRGIRGVVLNVLRAFEAKDLLMAIIAAGEVVGGAALDGKRTGWWCPSASGSHRREVVVPACDRSGHWTFWGERERERKEKSRRKYQFHF